MKHLTFVALCLTLATVVWTYPAETYDPNLGDGIDIDQILQSNRLRKNYLTCFKTGDKCTPQAKQVKDLIPDALTTGCAKCTERHRELGRKVLRFTVKHHPEEFLELERIHDPERKYRKNFAKELTDEGLVLPN